MAGYIKEMRKLIGQRPLLLCGTCVLIFNEAGEVLMEERSDNRCWGFPGGAVEPGERTEEAAVREVREETGLVIEPADLTLFSVFSGEELHYVYPNGDEVYIIDIVYETRRYAGMPAANEESLQLKFFAVDAIPSAISPPVIPVVRELQRRYAAADGRAGKA